MIKTFTFLMFMVVILPSLGLTSAQALFEWAVQSNGTYRWECVFLPNNGAFFVNYVITSSFIGTALELMRFNELFLYACMLACARSKAEIPGIRRKLLWEFNFGVQYAWTLLNYTLVTAYSVSCPLITPFGFVYLLQKHFVDRYNIFFAYAPSRINKKIHVAAINCVMFAFLIVQLTLFFFSLLRYGLRGVTIFALVGFSVSLALLVFQASFRFLRSLAPISYRVSECEQGTRESDVNETKFANTAAGDLLHAESGCSAADRMMEKGRDSTSPRTRVESFSKANSQGSNGSTFVPEVLSEPQFNGPAHLMETIATPLEGHSINVALNGDSVDARGSVSSKSSTTASEQVYSYQKYDEQEDP